MLCYGKSSQQLATNTRMDEILQLITPYIRMLDSDWLIAVIFSTNSGVAL
jgi:hypothetical protein